MTQVKKKYEEKNSVKKIAMKQDKKNDDVYLKKIEFYVKPL